MSFTFSPRRTVVLIHAYAKLAKDEGQRSLGSKDGMQWTDRQTDGADCITFHGYHAVGKQAQTQVMRTVVPA